MSPLPRSSSPEVSQAAEISIEKIVEAWAQGFNVGALILLILFTLCNYRRHVLLHKLILIELILAIWHGLFTFFQDPAYSWVLSATAVPLYISYNLHNVISWMKIKPFLPRWGYRFFIISLGLVQPYWILETFANFQYFNLNGHIFKDSRFYEPLARDPWWIFTTVKLVLVIQQNYEYTLTGLIRHSPRFGIMLLCMFLSIVFLVTDVAVTARISTQSGINPYWRLALVFKCASDTVFLDDFKSVLDRIAESALKRIAHLPYGSDTRGGRKESMVRQRGRASHHDFNPLQTVTVSAGDHNSVSNDGSQGGGNVSVHHTKHSRMPWSSSHSNTLSKSHHSRATSLDQGLGRHNQIRAETTITISEQEDARRKESLSGGGTSSFSSQEGILGVPTSTHNGSTNNSTAYAWVERSPPMSTTQSQPKPEGNIPMLPMRAKTSTGHSPCFS